MASFFAPLRRILRRDWKYGLWPLNGKKSQDLTVQDLEQSLRSTNGAIQALAEEIAMLRLPQDMTHDGQVEARNWCSGVATLPPKMWNYDEFCAAGANDNPLSAMDESGNIHNGLGQKTRGLSFYEGNIVIQQRIANQPKGPRFLPFPPGVILRYTAGDVAGPCALALTSGTVSARVTATLGNGEARLLTINSSNNALVLGSTVPVLNPYDTAIASGIYLLLVQTARKNGKPVWLVTSDVNHGSDNRLISSQFDILSSEPTLSAGSGTTVPFDTDEVAMTNNANIAKTATAGHIKCLLGGRIDITAKVLGKRTVNDSNQNIWTIWLQKSTDGGSTWTHVLDSQAVGSAWYVTSGIGLIFNQQIDVNANDQIRVRAMQENGSSGDVQIVSQLQPTIDGSTLHYGSKLRVMYTFTTT